MIKLKPLEYFILNITIFLIGNIIFYNFPFNWLFLLGFGIFSKPVRLLAFFLVLGFGVMFIRFDDLKTAKWENMQNLQVEGIVKKLYFKKGKQRALIQIKKSKEQLIASFTAEHSLKLNDEAIFDGVFIAFPPKVYPTFYDIELKSRFNGIVGYIKVYDYKITKTSFSPLQEVKDYIFKILGQFEKENTKSIAMALILGDKGKIKEEDYNTFKRAGLAHILAISGLHMTIVFVLIFKVFFRIFAFTPFCIKYNTKQISAFFGFCFGLFYLLLSGVPVSGLRSFIMASLVFCAFFESSGIAGVRSLGIAMFLILIACPEEAFFPSFQLSFASVLCLLYSGVFSFKNRFGNYLFSVIFSSFLVCLITTPFAIYHFNFVHFYGVISNIIAIPILIFFIMPFAILSFFNFKPFIMAFEFGIDVLFTISNFISSLPFSSIFMPHFNGYLLFVYSISLIFTLCFKKKIRIFAGLILVATILTYFITAKKPFIITNNKYTVLKDGENYISLFYIPEGFLKDVWEEKLNTKFIPIKRAGLHNLQCIEGVCYSFNPNFTVIYDEAVINLQKCTGGIFINTASNNEDFNCNFKTIITLKYLEEKGQEPLVFY